MTQETKNAFRPRPGRIKSAPSSGRHRTFLARVVKSISKAGPQASTTRNTARHGKRSHGRRVLVKARIVRLSVSGVGGLRAHLNYIRRDSALSPEDKGKVFNHDSDDANQKSFREKVSKDRHYFRFVVSPEDGDEMEKLKPMVRTLMSRMQEDLKTDLEWVAAVHYDTGHPHCHIVLRGKRSNGRDLVIPRAYISHGIRERAQEIVSLELGPRTALEADRKLARLVSAERFTSIDKKLLNIQSQMGEVGLQEFPVTHRAIYLKRIRKLQKMGLAVKSSKTAWTIDPALQKKLSGGIQPGSPSKAVQMDRSK